ncbi:MAG TPA: PIN domain-containing protein [Ilumatobacteraceae bacterium]|nr:PIN domain-containing protein [Ilumatobacteraceae bacterium]
MTVLLDAFALIAYLRDEPAAPTVQELLWKGELAMSAVQVAEVVDRMERIDGVPADEIEVAVSALAIEVIPVDYAVAVEAGRLRARHYGPTGRTLSLADAFCAATALNNACSVATADPVLIAVVRAEGLPAVELSASG